MFNKDFYPTTQNTVWKMIGKLSNREPEHFLDPNGGRGDIAEVIRARYGKQVTVDVIETDPDLVAILRSKNFNLVGYDWLEYQGVSYYDAILMNPPFSNGDVHLLKAWDFLHHGEIVCLLNAETIRNPFTQTRKRLAEVIKLHGSVEEIGDPFKNALRSTSVEVAMVHLKKNSEDDRVEVWETSTQEKPIDDETAGADPNWLAIRDELGNMEHYYNMANTHMLQGFQHLRKAFLYMEANNIGRRSDYTQIVGMALANINPARAEYVRKHRRDCWMHVFSRLEFTKWLDKLQREELMRDVEMNANIPFTAANIKGTLENVLAQKHKLFQKSVANVFDSLTKHFDGNTNHTEGWKTNDSYKVNQKLIFPYGCSYYEYEMNKFSIYRAYHNGVDVYNDLDRVVAILDKRTLDDIHTIGQALSLKFDTLGYKPMFYDNTCESTYFHIRFFKKGTVHLKWKRKDLWEKFNITASAGKRWLADSSGKWYTGDPDSPTRRAPKASKPTTEQPAQPGQGLASMSETPVTDRPDLDALLSEMQAAMMF